MDDLLQVPPTPVGSLLKYSNTDELCAIVLQITHSLQQTQLHSQMKCVSQDSVVTPSCNSSDLKSFVRTYLHDSGWENKLKNAVYIEVMRHGASLKWPGISSEPRREPVGYLRKAQNTWEKRILKSLNSMCTEIGIPLARKRVKQEQMEMKSKWNELGTDEPDLSRFRPVYAPKDFLEVIENLHNSNCNMSQHTSASNIWGLVRIPINSKDIHQLRSEFTELSIGTCQIGIDDMSELTSDYFSSDKESLGNKVLHHNSSPVAKQYAKSGCPAGLRTNLWSLILGVSVDDKEILYYNQLKTYVLLYDLLIDKLIFKDIKLTATNDDFYFVFEDGLYQAALVFSRDTHILRTLSVAGTAVSYKSYIRGKLGVEEFAVCYPPSGVIPFHGFAMYISPLCFLFNDPVRLYLAFREIYCRYLIRLHCISSHPQGIVCLCVLFESILQAEQPALFNHLKSVGAQPLKIAFRWLMRAFAGFLAPGQILLLWDRMLGYDSVDILAVAAVAIFTYRRNNLMSVSSLAAAEAVLADLTTLKIIPLIQVTLYGK